MIEIKTKLRKWGNSFGVVIPQKVIEKEKSKEGDEIKIIIQTEKPNTKSLFGKFPRASKKSPQKIKNEMKEGW